MTFRICFVSYKDSLHDSIRDFQRSRDGELLKPRDKQYVEAEGKLIERRTAMKLLFDANANPGIQELLKYCYKQANCSTEKFPDAEVDPRFILQTPPPSPPPAPIPPVAQIRQPVQQQQLQQFPQMFPQFLPNLQQPIHPALQQHQQNFNNSIPHQQLYQNFNYSFPLMNPQQIHLPFNFVNYIRPPF